MNTFDVLNGFMILIGLYVLLMTVKMERSGKIPSLFLAAEEEKKVKDAAGFIKKVKFPFLLFSVVMMVIAVMGLAAIHLFDMKWFRYVELAVFLLCWMYFMKAYQDARANFID